MKNHLLTFVFSLLFLGCSNDNNSTSKLPPETQIGANTFGVTIKGKVYIPRELPGGIFGGSGRAMMFWGSPDNVSWDEIEVKDGASTVGFQMYIHMEPRASVGKIILHQSNFHNGIDSTPFSHIFFKIWDSSISNYAYYGSIENLGEVNITYRANGIISGNFKGKFVRYNDPADFIEITDGRFDIDTFTLAEHHFP